MLGYCDNTELAKIIVITLGHTSDTEGVLRDEGEDNEGECGLEEYDLSDGNVYEEYSDSSIAKLDTEGYESPNSSPSAHLVFSCISGSGTSRIV